MAGSGKTRFLGLQRSPSLKAAVPSILATTKTGIALAVISGSLLFISDPLEFWNNPAFRLKRAAFAAASSTHCCSKVIWQIENKAQ
jgi:hypothetical protein